MCVGLAEDSDIDDVDEELIASSSAKRGRIPAFGFGDDDSSEGASAPLSSAAAASLALAVAGRALSAPSAWQEAAAASASAGARELYLADLSAGDMPEGLELLPAEPFWPRFAALRRAKLLTELAAGEAA